ncbi:PHP domain-containing protein [Candidatus Nitrospira bockiana]
MIHVDLHLHSHYSFDCLVRPSVILAEARRKGLSGVAVTDHDTIRGAVAAAELNDDGDLVVIVGAEYKTEIGDVIGLFLTDEIRTRDPWEVIGEIHRQGGLAVLPHPYHGTGAALAVAGAVDLIEVFNARETPENNRRAFELAKQLHKPMISASDAHFAGDIGTSRMILPPGDIRTALLRGTGSLMTGYSPRYKTPASQMVKAWKLGRYRTLPYHGARVVKRLVCDR